MYKIGDVVKSKAHKGCGMIVYIHPIDEIDLIIDYGKEWASNYSEDVKLATQLQRENFIKKWVKEK